MNIPDHILELISKTLKPYCGAITPALLKRKLERVECELVLISYESYAELVNIKTQTVRQKVYAGTLKTSKNKGAHPMVEISMSEYIKLTNKKDARCVKENASKN